MRYLAAGVGYDAQCLTGAANCGKGLLGKRVDRRVVQHKRILAAGQLRYGLRRHRGCFGKAAHDCRAYRLELACHEHHQCRNNKCSRCDG